MLLGFLIPLLKLSDYFFKVVGVFGFWHILKQNIGFLNLYSRGIDRSCVVQNCIEKYLMYFGSISFFLYRVYLEAGDSSYGYWFFSLHFCVLVFFLIVMTIYVVYLSSHYNKITINVFNECSG